MLVLKHIVMQLRSGRRDQEPAKDRPPIPHFIVSVARGPELSKVRSITELCVLRVSVETYVSPKGPLQCKSCQRFGHTQRNCGHAPRFVACGGSHLSGDCPARPVQSRCCFCGGNHSANYRGCVKWKEARAAFAKQAPAQLRRPNSQGQPAAPKTKRAEPSAEQMGLGEGWSHVVRGWRVVKATTPLPKPASKAPKQPKVAAAAKKTKPDTAEPKATAAPKAAVIIIQ